MDIKGMLSEFGLSDKETSVYIALLELGPSPARVVARRAGVNRGTAYDMLRKLVELGLASFYKKGKQHFAAEAPEKLIDAVEDKQTQLQRLKHEITAKLPELKSLFVQQGGRPTIKVYEGAKGVKKILDDLLATMSRSETKEYYVYSSATSKERQAVYEEFPEFNQKRIEKGIKVRTIALGEGGKTAGLDERKQLPAGKKQTSVTHELIYAGKIAHIGLAAGNAPFGVIIENEGIYETQASIFISLWNKLKDSK